MLALKLTKGRELGQTSIVWRPRHRWNGFVLVLVLVLVLEMPRKTEDENENEDEDEIVRASGLKRRLLVFSTFAA
jgi:hypothetical protein